MTMKLESAAYLKDLYWGEGEFARDGGVVHDIWAGLWKGQVPVVDPDSDTALGGLVDALEKAILAIQSRDPFETATWLHTVAVIAIGMQMQLVVVGKEGYESDAEFSAP